MNVTKELIDAWVKNSPEWAVEIVRRENKQDPDDYAYAYVGENSYGYKYILISNDTYGYVGKRFAFQKFTGSSGHTYVNIKDLRKYQHTEEPAVGEDVLVHFDGDNSSVWTKFKLEYQKGDVVVLYDYRIEDVESYSFSRITMKKYVKTVRENAIDQIASLIGRGTFAEDAEAIYDAIKSNEISIFTEDK